MRKSLSFFTSALHYCFTPFSQIKILIFVLAASAFSQAGYSQISGSSSVCAGSTVTLTGAPTGGIWSSGSPAIATVGSSSGIVTGVTAGTATISYVAGASTFTKVVTVNALPPACTVTGGGSYCAGGVGLHVGLSCSSVGVSYQLYNGPGMVGSAIAGTGAALDFGFQTGAGTYTVIATNTTTGCTRTMSGSVTITINSAPSAIAGQTAYCVGATATLSSSPSGGVWASTTPAVATIGSSSGIVAASATGTSTISYTIPATGCYATTTVTVTTTPPAFTVPSSVCSGAMDTLTDATPGGVWSSGTTSVATIGSISGVLTGVSSGVTTIVYSLGTLSCTVTNTVSVTPGPAAITGAATACVGSTVTLTDATPGGTWGSSSTTIATVSGGVVTGMDPGTAVISYTVGGCASTLMITVNSTPSLISGPAELCIGYSATYTDAVVGGVWSTVSPDITIGSATGYVTGVASGVASINYAIGSCFTTTTVTVVPVPAAITGSGTVCAGQTTTLADATVGGTWTSSNPAIASVGPGTGIVTGVVSGTVIISYTTGCTVFAPMVVNALSPITGTPTACVGQTTVLADATPSGTWSSAAPSVATVSTSGVVTGVIAGTTTIKYTTTSGCIASIIVTVNPLPSAIAGPSIVCVTDSIILSDGTAGGTWSSSNPAVASFGVSGALIGVSAGTAIITYDLGSTTGCFVTKTITVNALPAAIAGPNQVCLTSTAAFTDVGAGTWSSSAPIVAAIGSASGIATGISLGTATITFTQGGCIATKPISVVNMPPAASGPDSICIGSSAFFTDPAGPGTWTSSSAFIATVGSSTGLVTGMNAGTATITYTESPGCIATRIVTVNMLPVPITGTTNICPGMTTTLTDAVSSGVWSSSNPGVATIDSNAGVVTAIVSGVTIINYTLPTGCSTSVLFTVSSGPLPVTGYSHLCIGASAAFTDPTVGGFWVSSAPGIASVSTSGVVTGVAVGSAVISYSTGTVCPATMAVTVTPLPSAIAGSSNICVGSTTTLTEAVGGGVWSSGNTAVATVGSTGIVTAISASPVNIFYTIGPACTATKSMTVNALPAPITGPGAVCQFQAITLSDITTGGTWSSSNPAIGSIDALGNVTGITAGITTITYSNGAGCITTFPVTVNLSPAPITGSTVVCYSQTSTLSDAVPGGVWSSLNTPVATVGTASGVVSGVSLGTATIVYMLPGSCLTSVIVTVDPLPTVYTVSGGGSHCAFDTGVHILLSGSDVGFNYMLYRGTTAVGAFAGSGGVIDFGLLTTAGTYTVYSANTATGCSVKMIDSAVVTILPTDTTSVGIVASHGDTICTGAAATFTPVPVNGGTSPSYRWTVNSTPVSLATSYTYIPANGDIVKVTMLSNAVCPLPDSVSDSVTMVVRAFVHPGVSLAVSPDDTVCQGTHVTLTPIPTYGGPSPSYAWVKNGVAAGISPTYVFVPANGDVVYCVITSDYQCLSSALDTSAPVTMTIDTPVIPSVFIGAFPGTTVIQGSMDTLIAYVSHAVSPSYQWYVNNTMIPSATTNTYINTYAAITNDSITVEVTSNDQCRISTFQFVFVNVVTGINELSLGNDINVMPNPNKGEFTIKGTLGSVTDEEVNIEMADMLGRVVYSRKILVQNGKLDAHIQPESPLANGMYLLSVHTGSESKVFHVVVEQ